MKIEELLCKLMATCDWAGSHDSDYADNEIIALRAEILKRFAELEEQVENLKKEERG